MRVFVAEKPSVAREIARVLGCVHKEQGFFRGPHGMVTYAIGHLVRFAEPHEMNPAWGKPWRRDALPMIPRGPDGWRLVAEESSREQFDIVKRLLLQRGVSEIVNATDAGREGEAIFRRIYALSGCTRTVLRFWTSSLTEDAIEEALQRLRPAADYDGLAAAAAARAQLDWLIGMNHTRASTLHNGVLCSIGRVQTPTLAMIVRRHHAIANWVRTFFYEVHAEITGASTDFVARALNPQQKYDFERKELAEAILRDVPEGTPAEVTAVEKTPRRTPPPQLHNLGELQKEANRRFGLTADRTLEVAQSLYESKAITYPRSSSRYLSEDMVAGLTAVLKAIRLPGKESSLAAALQRSISGPKPSKRFVDGSKLSDHHAIIPTAKGAPASLGGDERKIYAMVAERFVSMFLPDKETEETRITLSIAGHAFRASGSRVVVPGWTSLTGGEPIEARADEAEERQPLPPVVAGQQLSVLDAELVTKERKPPARYTDATLLAAMETAGREIEDDALREAMKGRGLGTEATRSAIIKRLLELGYVRREGKLLEAEGKGIALIAQIEQALPHLASPELTGDMEAKLEQVELGRSEAATLLAEVAEDLKRDLPAVFRTATIEAPKLAPITPGKDAEGKDQLVCPKCRAGLLTMRPGQTFYGCARFREGCSFTLNTVIAKKVLTAGQVRELLGPKHRTKVIRGFKSKENRPFDASLVLREGRVEFEFPR
jgi:DNA topoisomerase-3